MPPGIGYGNMLGEYVPPPPDVQALLELRRRGEAALAAGQTPVLTPQEQALIQSQYTPVEARPRFDWGSFMRETDPLGIASGVVGAVSGRGFFPAAADTMRRQAANVREFWGGADARGGAFPTTPPPPETPPPPMSAIPPEPEAVQAEAPVAALPVAPSQEVMRESARGVLADPNATPDQRMRAWAALGISGEAVESVEQARRDPAYAALLRRGTELERERNRLMRDVGAGGEQWRFGPQPWQVTTQIGGPRAPTAEPAMGGVFRAAPYGTAGNDAMAYRSMLGRGMTREQAQRNVQAKRRETAAARNLADVRRERELARQERRETRQEAFDIEREKIDVQREQGRIAVLMRQQAAERAMEESQRKLREYAAQLATKAQIDEAVELGKRDRNVEGARSVLTAKQQSAINMLTSKDPEKRRKLFAMYAQFVQEGMKNGLPATKINENFYQQVVRNAKAYGI